tara:strand:- start:55 stop:450 length:396 start_codon:yes stop_codon:yes gene_type:complete
MKLELKHLAPYLPYGLKYNNIKNNNTYTMRSISTEINMVDFGWGDAMELNEVKPILRPLSDLTKEIKHDGDKFTPCTDYYYLKDELEELSTLDSSYIRYTRYNVVKVLFELHFDVFGLIEKGLAIDINTLT